MMWSWPGMPAWGYALTTAGMIVFWTLVIFGAIVLVHYLGREKQPEVGHPGLPSHPRSARRFNVHYLSWSRRHIG